MKNSFKKLIAWSLIAGLTFQAMPVWALSKNETIYANTNSDGSIKSAVISEHLNDNGASTITDYSRLNDIENVNGYETYTEKNNSLVWETEGNDIYYEGTTNEELPISMSVKYYLDGEEMDVSDMLGKSGKVKIVLSYTNNLKQYVLINGHTEELYTPFVIATTSIVSNTENKNITVTNGRVIDNGVSSVIVALSSPGLYESLDISELKKLDNVVISYDTEDFELNSIYSVATPKILSDTDLDIFDDLDGLYSKINELTSASSKLVDGANQVLDGANQVKDGASQLSDGINSAYEGSETINNEVKNSINKLQSDTTYALDEDTLNSIVKQAVSAASLTDSQKEEIAASAEKEVKEKEEYKELETEYNKYTALAEQASDAYQSYIAAGDEETANTYKEQMESATIAATTYSTMMDIMVKTAKETAANTASSVSTKVAAAVSKEVATTVANNAKEQFVSSTVSSLTTLSNGLDELTNGLSKLNDGASTLYDGTSTLTTGIKTLSEGLEAFDSEGIQKIADFVNGDLKDIQARVQALVNLSNNYKTFDDINSDADGETKIIFMIDELKKEKQKETTETAVVEEKTFWQRIKGLFK